MKKYIILALISIMALQGNAQRRADKDPQRDKIRAHKVAFLTERLDLTPEEAEKFWPLYNEFEEKREMIQQELLEEAGGAGRTPENMSDEELDKLIKGKLQNELEIVTLKSDYYEKFKKVLSVRQVHTLYRSELEFRKMLLERLKPGGPPR